ncbi:MAG: hypothetical protein JO210_04950 [Acidobacteriaceae bacterium]|nr:hypothetical protein [Acidobacteriaceae bacterium]
MLTLKTVTTACFAIMLSVGSTRAGAQVATNEHHGEWFDSAEGTWNCKVDRITQGGSFNVFMSFAAGGVVVATGSLDKLNPVSTVFGSWKQIGRKRIDATIYFYLFDPIGNPLGTLKTNETLRLNGQNEIAGTGLSFTCDVAGENCGDSPIGQINITGTRIVAEGVKD